MDEEPAMKETVSCQQVRSMIEEAGGALPTVPEKEPFREHLNGCPDCRHFSEEHRSLMEAFLQDRLPDPGPEFWNRMTTRIMAEVRHREIPPEPWYKRIGLNPFGWPVYAWSPALALLVVAALWFNYNPATRPLQISGNGLSEVLVLDEGIDPLADRLSTLTARESARLKQKVVAGLAKDLKTDSSEEAVLDWDLNNRFEALTSEELERVANKLQTIGPTGAAEGFHHVS
jgi:hypothetical protein